MVITSEHLAISAIFIMGFYLGIKTKEAIYKLRIYFKNNYSKE